MMSINILNMRGSFNGVWGATMEASQTPSHKEMRTAIINTFKSQYQLGEDPNDILSDIIDDFGYANALTNEDYSYINYEISLILKRRFI